MSSARSVSSRIRILNLASNVRRRGRASTSVSGALPFGWPTSACFSMGSRPHRPYSTLRGGRFLTHVGRGGIEAHDHSHRRRR
jgi:hypothetical protein